MRISHILKKTEKAVRKIPAFLRSFKTKLHSLKSDSPSFNKLIRSSVALALMVIMLITLTFSWLCDNFSSNIKSNDFITIDADAGLQMNYGDTNQPDGSININTVLKNGFELQECSSVDGRTIFFPTSEYSDSEKEYVIDENGKKTDLIVNTDDLLFREATANDKNTKYISVDFSLTSQGDTDIWLSSASKIYCTDSKHEAANALRIAFVDRSVGGKSTVFDNSFAEGYTEDHYPVESISTTGVADNDTAYKPHAFCEYMYGNENKNTLFHIEAGKTLNASMVVWLEGTDADCDKDVLGIEDIQIKIGLVTSYEEMKPITFIDKTLEKWVDDADCFVFILDDNEVPHLMTKSENYESDYTWTGYLPKGVNNVKFARYNPNSQSNSPEKWNNWDAGALGVCTTYNAIGHSAGIWADNLETQVITVFDGTPEQKFLNARSNHLMHIQYSVTDGNNNIANLDYKMSYQYVTKDDNSYIDYKKWCMVIPAAASNITFKWCESPPNVDKYKPSNLKVNNSWQNTERNDNLYFTITKNGTNFGSYWSNKLIYLNDTNNYENGAIFAAYFYNRNSWYGSWTSMQAKVTSEELNKELHVAAVPPDLLVDNNPDKATIYFTNINEWDKPYVHYWGVSSGSQWPGIAMTYSHQNSLNQAIYKAEVPMYAIGLTFNDNGKSQHPADIRDPSLKDGIGYYYDSNTKSMISYELPDSDTYGVVIARYATNKSEWKFEDGYLYNQIESSKEFFGTNNLFTFNGYKGTDNKTIDGEWSEHNE